MIKLSFLFGIILGLSHFEGGLVALSAQDRGRQDLLRILQPFSSGALLSLALIHLIPFSIMFLPWSSIIFLVTISGLMVLSEFGKPDRLLVLPPKWGQRFLLSIYALSLGLLIGLDIKSGLRLAIIATIVGIPSQFVQGVKGFANKSSQLDRKEFFERLFLTSLPVPLTILIIQRLSPWLNPFSSGLLISFATAVILYQGILEFRIPYPFQFSPLKIFYFLTGVFIIYCL